MSTELVMALERCVSVLSRLTIDRGKLTIDRSKFDRGKFQSALMKGH